MALRLQADGADNFVFSTAPWPYTCGSAHAGGLRAAGSLEDTRQRSLDWGWGGRFSSTGRDQVSFKASFIIRMHLLVLISFLRFQKFFQDTSGRALF